MTFMVDRKKLYETENFHARDNWSQRLGCKTGDPVFAYAWKRLLAGELYEDGPVLASDGRYVQAHRNERYRVMLMGESEVPWFRGLMAEASAKLDPVAHGEWTNLDGFIAMLGAERDGTDPVSRNALELWRRMEGQEFERRRGDHLRSIHNLAPKPRKGHQELWIDTPHAIDIACGILSKSHIEVSEDWLTADQASGLLGVQDDDRGRWDALALMIDRGEPFDSAGGLVPAAMRRSRVSPGVKPAMLAVVHGSGLPLLARDLGLDNPDRFAPPSTPSIHPREKRKLARRTEPSRQTAAAVAPRPSQPVRSTQLPREGRSVSRSQPPAFRDGGRDKVLLVDGAGKPWAIALGKGDHGASGAAGSKMLATSLGSPAHAATVGEAVIRARPVPHDGEDIPDGSEALLVEAQPERPALVGNEAARALSPVALTSDPNHLYVVWGGGTFGLMGRNRLDRTLVLEVGLALRSGNLAVCSRPDTGPVLVIADRVDPDQGLDEVLDLVKDQQRLNAGNRYTRSRCDPPIPGVLPKP